MFSTEETVEVTLLCAEKLMKAVIDHFGPSVRTRPIGDSQFYATVKVCTSPTFYRWVFGWNGDMKIEAPVSVVQDYLNMLESEIGLYRSS